MRLVSSIGQTFPALMVPFILVVILVWISVVPSDAYAASAREIDVRVDEALSTFYQEVKGGD